MHRTLKYIRFNFYRPYLMTVLLCSLISPALPTRADVPNVQVLLSSDASYYDRVSTSISKILTTQNSNIILNTTRLTDSIDLTTASSLIIAVGANACKESLNSHNPSPLLCTFLPRQNFDHTLKAYLDKNPTQTRQVSGIYLDQPWMRYLQLAKVLVSNSKKVGMAFGTSSTKAINTAQTQAHKLGLTIEYAVLSTDKTAAKDLTPVLDNSQVFLATANPTIITKATAKWLLYYSIRKRKPVIAYSQSWVKAGALAAVYSNPEDIGQDISETILALFKKQPISLNEPRYPNHFSVTANASVARSFGMRLPDNNNLKQLIVGPSSTPNFAPLETDDAD